MPAAWKARVAMRDGKIAELALPVDNEARDAFRDRWRENFAVNANAGSGKTTAISRRLARMALSAEAKDVLPFTAVVTFTKKAAQQIGQKAREALLEEITKAAAGGAGRARSPSAPESADGNDGGLGETALPADSRAGSPCHGDSRAGSPCHAEPRAGSPCHVQSMSALNHLERAFFGTIHGFCLLLAKRYGHTLGINQNPDVVDGEDELAYWEEFIEQDSMSFASLAPAQLEAFLRHVPLEDIFELTRSLTPSLAEHFIARKPEGAIAEPDLTALALIQGASTNRKDLAERLRRNQKATCNLRHKEDTNYIRLR